VTAALRLNLGANDRALPGFLSVDRVPPADVITDLRERWPWADSSVTEVYASHLFEHLPDRIFTMNELWRVLEPGGRAVIEVPSASHGSGWAQDPTHCSAWCLNSFLYYQNGTAEHTRFAAGYGIVASFHVAELSESPYHHGREQVYVVRAVLVAVK